MPWNWSKAVPESSGSVPKQEAFESTQPTLVNVYRLFREQLEIMDELVEEMRATE